MSEYSKQCIRELKHDLRQLPTRERLTALIAYETGLMYGFSQCSPPVAVAPTQLALEEGRDGKYAGFFQKGNYVAQQFGELEAASQRDFFLSKIRSSLWRICNDRFDNFVDWIQFWQ